MEDNINIIDYFAGKQCSMTPMSVFYSLILDFKKTGQMNPRLADHIEVCALCNHHCEEASILRLVYCASLQKLLEDNEWATSLFNKKFNIPNWFEDHKKSCGTCSDEIKKIFQLIGLYPKEFMSDPDIQKHAAGILQAAYEGLYVNHKVRDEIENMPALEAIHFLITADFPTWRTLNLGAYPNPKSIQKVLEKRVMKSMA